MNSTNNNKLSRLTWLAFPYTIWMIGFIVIPILVVVYYAFTSKETGGFTIENISLITQPEYIKSLWLSIKLSLISTLVCFLIAYPLALVLKSLNLKGKSFMVLIFILPMWMNSLLRTIAWQNILERNGIINKILEMLTLPKLDIINTPSAIVLGMVYDFLPFMILPLYNTISKIDDNVINAARDLGANYFNTLVRVIFPLSIPGIISGITMVFVPSLTTFAISDILGGSKVVLIGNVIEQQFQKLNNRNAGAGLSMVLMLFIIISMVLVAKYDKESEGSSVW